MGCFSGLAFSNPVLQFRNVMLLKHHFDYHFLFSITTFYKGYWKTDGFLLSNNTTQYCYYNQYLTNIILTNI
jgi:hypothetical protein